MGKLDRMKNEIAEMVSKQRAYKAGMKHGSKTCQSEAYFMSCRLRVMYLAYGLLRGRTINQIENNHENIYDLKPDRYSVMKMALGIRNAIMEYCPDGPDSEWCNAAIEKLG